MRLNAPLDKILNSEVKVRILRAFCRSADEINGRQMAKMVGVTPKTAHEALQALLQEGLLIMRPAGKTYLFCLNEDRAVVMDLLKPLFAAEDILSEKLFEVIRLAIQKSSLKNDILSVAVFGSVHARTDHAVSDVDLLAVVRTSDSKKKAETLFADIDQQTSTGWGNIISPYINSLAEFRSNAKKKTGVIPVVLKAHQIIYGDRLEKLLR